MTSMFDDAPLNEEELSIRLRGASKETIFQLAYDVVEDRTKESVLFDATVDDRIPRFERIELKLGRNDKVELIAPSGERVKVKFKKIDQYLMKGYTRG